MTNHEYERASVEAAVGLRKLAAVDAKITETESALVYLLHQRREIVNQYDLNKGGKLPVERTYIGSEGAA